MAMDIGGDDSVAWTATRVGDLVIELEQDRRKLHTKQRNRYAVNLNKGADFVEGRDPVNTKGKFFRITIKLPKGDKQRAAFLKQFQDPPKATAGKISFTLPIERQNYDQIHVDWPTGQGNALV